MALIKRSIKFILCNKWLVKVTKSELNLSKMVGTTLFVCRHVSDHISWQWLSPTIRLICPWACATVCMTQIVPCALDSRLILFFYVLKPFKWLVRSLRVDKVACRIKI